MDTDIIIPIYNAFDFTKKCIETVIEHTDLTKHTLLLINDKSTDQRILPLLTLFTTEYPSLNITIINNESNQGFVRTVNIGMQHSSRDVVLLNSDTEVTKNWLPKIQKCAYSKAAIATVTPLSNNATLASVPDFMSENTIPSDFTIEEYAEIVERCSMDLFPEIPTANGFCTNYILKELGQPMHAFDSSYIEGNAIHVRRAHDKEKIMTLDEKEFELNENNLVICDGVKPVALAGIMGGLNSEIRDTTEAVIFESAKFARDNIRKSSRALGQSSDSSQRYAKGVDEYATVMASKRALHLIEELGCGKVSSTHVEVSTGNSIEPAEMKASIKKVNGVLGIEVPTADIERILKSLNFQPVINGDELTIQVPAYREDMESYPDIAEEVIRMYGYDHVTPTFLKAAAVTSGGMNIKQKTELKIKRALCAQGAFEGVHYSFFSPSDLNLLGLPEDAPERKAIRLINPINEDLSLMRTTLAPQMIHAIARNQKNGCLEGRVYEIGNKFIPKDLPLTEYPDERETICIGIWGKEENFFTLKGLVDTVAETLFIDFEYVEDKKTFLHPYRTAKILYNGEEIGYLGQLTYEIQKEEDMRESAYIAEIDLKALRPVYGKVPTFAPISRFAKETRDLALVMSKSVTCGEVEKAIAEASSFVESVELFDVYEGLQVGPEKKSMAFTVTFAPKEEEFTTEAVDGYVKKILKNLNNKLGVELRS